MVTIYTTDTCPRCKILKEKMKAKGVEYKEVQDIIIMSAKGISTVPVLEVDGDMMDFSKANKWVNEKE